MIRFLQRMIELKEIIKCIRYIRIEQARNHNNRILQGLIKNRKFIMISSKMTLLMIGIKTRINLIIRQWA